MQVATRYVVVTCYASSDVSCGRRLRRREETPCKPIFDGQHGDLDGEINIGDIVAISDYIMRKAW